MRKRVLSLILAVCLTAGMFSGWVSAVSSGTFTDVAASDWYYDAVEYVQTNGLMNGTGDGAFSPNALMTRGMIVTILHRMEGCPHAPSSRFVDVPAASYCADAAAWASAEGIVTGYDDGTLRPNDPVTRQQLAVILLRYCRYKGYDTDHRAALSSYEDAEAISDYARSAMQWAVGAGLMEGVSDRTLAPNGHATRGQAAALLMRLCTTKQEPQEEEHRRPGGSTLLPPSPDRPDDPDEPSGEEEPQITAAYLFSVTDLTVEQGAVTASYHAETDCRLTISFLTEDASEELFSLTEEASSDANEITLPLGETLPRYFIVTAQLTDEEGTPLHTLYVCRRYTSAYEAFERQTPEDFPDQVVLPFDESGSDFAVLSKEVLDLTCTDQVNTLVRAEGGRYTFDNIDDTLRSCAAGDKLYFCDENGDHYVLKVKSVSVTGDRAVVTEDPDAVLSDFYQTIKLDLTLTTEEPAPFALRSVPMADGHQLRGAGAQVLSASALSDDSITGDEELGSSISSTVETPFGSIKGTGSALVRLNILYDVILFGDDYFTCTLSCALKLDLTVTVEKGVTIAPDEPLTLFEYNFPLPASANLVNIPMEITVPYSIECDAAMTFGFHAETETGFIYDSETGYQGIQSKNVSTKDFHVGGELHGSLGLELKVGLGAFDEFIEAKVGAEAGVAFDGKADVVITSPNLNSQSYHACNLCIKGETYAYFNVPLQLSYEITDKLKGDIFDLELVHTRWFWNKFYGSLINDSLSVHGGAVKFGWGDCPNKRYQVKFVTYDNGTLSSGDTVNVDTLSGTPVASGTSPMTKYLYPGQYIARATVKENDVEESFSVQDAPCEVRLYAADSIIQGTIRDKEDQSPISGASVTATRDGEVIASGSTDASGRYKFSVPKGTYTLSVSAEGYSGVSREMRITEDTAFSAQLEKLKHTLSGTVTDKETGDPISGASVTVSRNDVQKASASTAADGSFSMTLSEGTYTLSVSASGYQGTTQAMTLTEDTARSLTLEKLPQIGTLLGTITDQDTGDALSGASVTATDAEGRSTTVTTASNGTYKTDLAAGVYSISISCEEYESKTYQEITIEHETTMVVSAALKRNMFSLTGVITEAGSDPTVYVAGASVTASKDGKVVETAVTGTDGQYRMMVPAGTYSMTVSASDYEDASGSATVTKDGGRFSASLEKLLGSGQCGPNLYWRLTTAGVMTIYGTGTMYDYTETAKLDEDDFAPPWEEIRGRIKTVIVEEGATSVGTLAFFSASNLTSLSLPNTLKVIGRQAFTGAKLSTITIPDSVERIGQASFSQLCSEHLTLHLGSGVKQIDYAAFSLAPLTSVTLPDSLTELGDSVFANCDKLQSVTLPKGLKHLSSSFMGCRALTQITLPSTLETIGNMAFEYCTSLTSITIPNSVTSIGRDAFRYCSSLQSVTLSKNLEGKLGNHAFAACNSLTTITVHEGVTRLGNYIFSDCTSMKTVYLPASLEYFDFDAIEASGVTDVYFAGTRDQWNTILHSDTPEGVTVHFSE